MRDLTIIYYTANHAPEKFLKKNQEQLLKAAGDIPIISVSQKPMDFGMNICVGDIGRSHLNIYRQALIGARAAATKYVAFAEDDILYSADHFDHIPQPGCFAYDMNIWALNTFYRPPSFCYNDRINFNGLISERKLFIEAMEERFNKYPRDDMVQIKYWAEPSKYEKHLSVTIRKRELYHANTPSVAFYHPAALSYEHLGRRKRIGKYVRIELSPWGFAKDILATYK